MARTSGLYDATSWSKILPGLRQYEATSGRRISDQAMRGLFRAQLDVEAQRGLQARRYADQQKLEEQRLALLQDQQQTMQGGMAVSGATQLLSSGAQLGLLYHGLRQPTGTPGNFNTGLYPGMGGAPMGSAPLAEGAGGFIGNIPGGGKTGQAALTGFTPVAGAGPLGTAGIGSTTAAAAPAAAGVAPYSGMPLAAGAAGPVGLAGGALGASALASYGLYKANKDESPLVRAGMTSAPISPFTAAPAALFKATKGQNPALRGAIAGSVVPGVGTAIGGLLGATGALGDKDK